MQELLEATDAKFEMLQKGDTNFDEFFDGHHSIYYRSSVIYDLPSSPYRALNWLGCFFYFLPNISKRFDAIHIGHKTSANPLQTASPQTTESRLQYFDEYLAKNRICPTDQTLFFAFVKSLLELKTEINPSDPYQYVFNELEKITAIYHKEKDQGNNFIKCIATSKRYEILAPDLMQALFSRTSNENLKITKLLDFAHLYRKIHSEEELNLFLNNIHRLWKRDLFALCIGKKAFDGNNYDWDFTEWNFLLYAEFILKNNRLCIVNLNANRGYQSYYQEGKSNYEVFAKEMEHLAHILSLSFEPNCNFHYELVFDEPSTLKLKNLGLHLTSTFVKNRLDQFTPTNDNKQNEYNLYRLFSLAQNQMNNVLNKIDSDGDEYDLKHSCTMT